MFRVQKHVFQEWLVKQMLSLQKTQVNVKDAATLQKLPASECKLLDNCRDPVAAAERKFYGHALASLLWERQVDESIPLQE